MVRRTAARVATALCLAAAALQFARGQSLERLTVESFNLNADTPSPKIDVPFHLTVTLRVRERIGEIENLDLPILAELELLGDERQTTGGPHGTLYRETIAVVAHNPGPIAIAPATLQAIDARDGKPKEWYTNGLTLRVTGSISPALNTGGQVVLAVVLRALHLLLWLLLFALGVGCIALIVLLLFIRGRPRLAAAVTEQPAPAESIVERSPRQQAQDALAVLRAQRSRAAAVAVRAAVWRTVGASDGETLADVLHRPEAQEVTLRQLLIALERNAFTYESDLDAALDDACSALERYIGSAA